ncbi:MAG: hypothetical protein ACKVOH_03985 [Chlamydiales bacterium]
MVSWQMWTIAIACMAFVGLFLVYTIVSCIALTRLTRSARRLMDDLEDKLHAIDPLCALVYRLGEAADHRVEDWLEEREEQSCHHSRTSKKVADLAEWALMGFSLFRNFKRRR